MAEGIHRRTIIALVHDKPGVLARISGLFRRRGVNIESLAVGHSEQVGFSRMTFVVGGAENSVKNISSQLNKLIDVVDASDISEKNIVLNKEVEKVIKFLEDANFVYKGKIKAPAGEDNKDWVEREQDLFKSTMFGDDIDRPIKKIDGGWTYFAPDIAYHYDKIKRNYDEIIDIFGADHSGYTARMKAIVKAKIFFIPLSLFELKKHY